jgi:hypothetical protein
MDSLLQVMRKPEGRSSLGPILQNLGLKQGKEFPSPQQFVKHEYGMDPKDERVSYIPSQRGSKTWIIAIYAPMV